MPAYKVILFSLSFLLYQSCLSQKMQSSKHIIVSAPTIEQEATSIWRTINDIKFLEGQGYRINLPENELIKSLIDKSKNGKFGNDDFPTIYNLLETKLYNKSNYEVALKKVNAQEKLINQLIDQLHTSKSSWNWGFNSFEKYTIIFTLYGTGGSYNADQGIVTLFTTMDGKFMNYKNPANTIMHEIVHMGIENSIVQKYNLPHGVKERLVDTFVYRMFKDALPNYKIQNMGDPKIETLLGDKKDFAQLDTIIQKYMSDK